YYKAPQGNYSYEWSVSEIGGAPFEPGNELLLIVGAADAEMVGVQVLGGGWLKLKITDKATGCISDCYVVVATTPNAACTLEGPVKACTNEEVTYSITPVEGATYNWTIEGDAVILSAMPYGSSIQVKAGGVGTYTVFLVITKEGECPSYCDWTTSVEVCGGAYCTYTQGYYGNIGGKACTPEGPRTTTALINSALASMPGNKLYLGKPGRSFTATTASYIIGILPGGGPSTMLPAGDYVNATSASFLRKGRVNNVLLSQTITLALNIYMPGSNLGALSLAGGAGMGDKWLVTVDKQGKCDLQNAVAASCKFSPIYSPCGDGQYISGYTTTYNPYRAMKLSSKVINALPGDKTIMDLLNLASAALGGTLPAGLSYSDIAGAVGLINEAFDECRIFVSIANTGNVSGYCVPPAPEMCAATMSTSAGNEVSVDAAAPSAQVRVEVKELTVNVYPNPFRSQLNFRFISPVSGSAKLEVFNVSGQRLATVFEGKVSAGVQNFVRYSPATNTAEMLIYKLTVGDKSVTGKVQSLK
ncbi:MAG: T9SS type A sorting domain-containing protein, partial [Chitinophagaceae bacterium]